MSRNHQRISSSPYKKTELHVEIAGVFSAAQYTGALAETVNTISLLIRNPDIGTLPSLIPVLLVQKI